MAQADDSHAAMAAKVGVGAGVVTWTTLFGQPIETWILWGSLLLTLFWIWGQAKIHVYAPLKVALASWKTGRVRRLSKRRRASDD